MRVTLEGAARCIGGNHDLGAAGRVPLERFSAPAAAALRWTRRSLGRPALARLAELAPDDSDGVPIFHGSPRDPIWEYITSIDQARAALEDRRVHLTLVGHTHVPFVWRFTPEGAMERLGVPRDGRLRLGEGRWLVNPGSVGQPRDGDARAAWALYDPDDATIHFRRTPYDVAGAQNAILSAGLPSMLANRLAQGR